MIDDIQDELSSYSPQDNNEPNRAGMLLVAFIVWVIFSTVIILIARPKIISAVRETNAVQIFRERRELREQAKTTEATLYFVSMKDNDSYNLIAFKTEVKQTGATPFHDALEGLLKGPTDAVLKYGAVSKIPYGTKLIGVTVSNYTAFISLSVENRFDNLEAARWQFLKTVQAIDQSIRQVVILIDGYEL